MDPKQDEASVIQTKKFPTSKGAAKKWKDSPQNGRACSKIRHLRAACYPEHIKNAHNSTRETNSPTEKQAKGFGRLLSKGKTQTAQKHKRRCSASLVVRDGPFRRHPQRRRWGDELSAGDGRVGRQTEHHVDFKKRETRPFVTMWLNLEDIILTGLSPTEKDKALLLCET